MFRGIFLALALLAPFAIAAHDPPPEPWWERTLMDADRDGLDDALPLAGSDRIIVLADFAKIPDAGDHAAIERAGFAIVDRYEHFDVLAVLAAPSDLPRLLDVPGVIFVERNDVIERLLKDSVPLTGAPTVWKQYGVTGNGISVAVLDDGAYEQHPDFDGRVAGSYDASARRTIGPLTIPAAALPILPAGEEGHATHVAGTIIGPGTQSSGTYKGVAPDAKFVDVKVFSGPNSTNSDIVLGGLDWMISNADRLRVRIISMSLGGSASDGTDALSRAVNVAVDQGFIVVAAAGNTGPNAGTITSPGAAEKAITVGAVDKKKAIAKYSSRGPTKDGRFKPDLVAPGSSITSTVPPVATSAIRSLLGRPAVHSAFYGELSGTSMAAPHVSGVIALMLEVNPDLTNNEVKRILLATAQDLGEKGRDNDTGYGFVNAIAAVQVAHDPTLLGSPRFAAVLDALPEPEKEDFFTRAEVEWEAAKRAGQITLIVAGLVTLAAVIVFGIAFARKRYP